MKTVFAIASLIAALLTTQPAIAVERTVKLAVQNMYCAACPHTVKAGLEAVPGVAKVIVSFDHKTAVVTFDDVKTSIKALTAATTNAGYPSAVKS